MTKILTTDVFDDFRKVVKKEIKIRPGHNPKQGFCEGKHILNLASEFFNMATRIFEIARSSSVPRSYNVSYNLSKDDFFYESVSAHTNLVSMITTLALDFCYGYGFGGFNKNWPETADGYSYRDVMEVVRLHDIAENETGDLPDNGSRDEEEKDRQELRYLKEYLEVYSEKDKDLRINILRLFREMQNQTSSTGKLLYLSDKVAALIITLCLDHLDHSPMILEDSPYASERDRAEMEKCDFAMGHAYKASEMWAIDFFQMRNIVKYDENFFFTALIVMSTLMVNGKWYSWREADY
ncbi:HD domain-containing protein [Candidatus Saccharibacteria bacterium]|nr:HD domain-containing protein [Candidatus Saccharibacteria bacterium]